MAVNSTYTPPPQVLVAGDNVVDLTQGTPGRVPVHSIRVINYTPAVITLAYDGPASAGGIQVPGNGGIWQDAPDTESGPLLAQLHVFAAGAAVGASVNGAAAGGVVVIATQMQGVAP